MRPNIILSATVAAQLASALGFASYREIRSGESERNAGEIAYHDTPRSNTLFLYIQIQPGVDDSDVIADFKTLANNYNAKGISVIPRVRYGVGETFMPEPEDQAQILADVDRWVDVFKEVKNMINIPVIQAGFLGLWGEWHVRWTNVYLVSERRIRILMKANDRTALSARRRASMRLGITFSSRPRSPIGSSPSVPRLLCDIPRITALLEQ